MSEPLAAMLVHAKQRDPSQFEIATHFAFRNTSTGTPEIDWQTTAVNSLGNSFESEGLFHRKQIKLQPSHLSDDMLSRLEKLPLDVLTNVYRYLFPGSLPLRLVNVFIPYIGMLSKNLYQTCVKYVQQEPLRLSNEYDPWT